MYSTVSASDWGDRKCFKPSHLARNHLRFNIPQTNLSSLRHFSPCQYWHIHHKILVKMVIIPHPKVSRDQRLAIKGQRCNVLPTFPPLKECIPPKLRISLFRILLYSGSSSALSANVLLGEDSASEYQWVIHQIPGRHLALCEDAYGYPSYSCLLLLLFSSYASLLASSISPPPATRSYRN